MCRVGVGWEPLDDIVERLVDGLTAGEAHGDTLTPANRHGPGRGSATATILEYVPRKGPAAEAAGQVSEGGETVSGGGRLLTAQVLAAGQRGNRGLRKG